jgi:hypothetical protein
MRWILTILTSGLFFLSGHSQTLYKGRLVSGLTDRPIKSGYIQFNERLLASTDSLGYFTIELDSSKNIALIFYSPEVRWVAIDNLQFHTNEIKVITLFPECFYSAEKDIKENNVKLFRAAGPFSILPTKADNKFEKKYNVTYYGDGGDIDALATDCIETYNHKIAIYLDKKYGKTWRKKVSKGVYIL